MTPTIYSAARTNQEWVFDRSGWLESHYMDGGRVHFSVGGHKDVDHFALLRKNFPESEDRCIFGPWSVKLQFEIPRKFPKTLHGPLRLFSADNYASRLLTSGTLMGGSVGLWSVSVGLTEERMPYVVSFFDSPYIDTGFPLWRGKKKLAVGKPHEITLKFSPGKEAGITVIKVDGATVQMKNKPNVPAEVPDDEVGITRVAFGIDAPDEHDQPVNLTYRRVEFKS